MKCSLTIVLAFFFGLSLSIRINGPARHFHRGSISSDQERRHQKFTQALNDVAATIQEAQKGFAEMEIADDRADVSEPQPQEKAVDDNQEDGTCRHPKDVNCKTREDLDSVPMPGDVKQDEVKPQIILEALAVNNTEETTEKIHDDEDDDEDDDDEDDEIGNNTETQIENSNTQEKIGNNTSSAEIKSINETILNETVLNEAVLNETVVNETVLNETVLNQEETINDTLVESLDPSQDRSDGPANQIIVDENEFEKEAIKEFEKEAITPPPTNSSLFSRLVKLFKRNSHVVGRAFLGV